MKLSPFVPAGMVFTLLVSIGLPILMLILLKRRTGRGIRAALVGALCFVVFAGVLEALLHALVLPLVIKIPWLYVLYGCLAAGVFEETGRLAGLHFLCKKSGPESTLATGLGYGIGHGGIEAILVAGIGSLANLAFVISYFAGESPALQKTAEIMMTTPAFLFWLGGFERVFALVLQIALSVLMWMVVTKRLPFWFYPVAIALHALADVSAAMMQVGLIDSMLLAEGYVAVVAVLTGVLVVWLYRRVARAAAVHAQQGQED